MKIFNCLDPSLSLRGRFFIEASAGSGKTFSMEQVLIRLLLDNDPLCLSQILVVTFTKDATREISQRIRKNIKASIVALENPEHVSIFEYLQVIKKGDVEQREMAILRLKQALHSFDEANIYTIHGFCLAMLSRFAFEANMVIGCTRDEDIEYPRELLKKWLISIPITEIGTCQLQSVFHSFKGDTTKLVERLLYFIKNRNDFIPTEPFVLQIDEIYVITKKFSLLQIGNLRNQLMQYLSTYQTSCNSQRILHPHYLLQIDEWISILSEPRISYSQINELLCHKSLLFHLLKEPKKKGSSHVHISEDLVGWLREVYQLIERMLDPSAIMFHIARRASAFIQEELIHTEQIFVDDILDRMILAIRNESFIAKIRHQFSAIMIDEFQDTDNKQWKIFSELFLSKKAKMQAIYLVGDPKQSIYSFRNANLDLYFLAEKNMGKNSKYRLDTNYRSSPRLIASINKLFDDGRWLFLKERQRPLRYRPASVGSTVEEILDNRCIGSIHFFILQLDKARSNKLSIQNKENSHIFPFIYREITELIEKEICKAEEIVVLVKDRYLARRLMDFFDSVSMAYRTKGMNSITTSLSFSLLYKFFSALSNVQKTQEIIDFFIHPLLQIPLDQLHDTTDNSAYTAAIHQLFLFSIQMIDGGLSNLFAKMYTVPFFGYSIIERICCRGNDAYSEFIQIIELIMVQFPGHIVHPQDIVHFLQTLQNKNPEEDPRIRKRILHSADALTIMTMHASKGLEFSVVFALGLGYRTPAPEKIIQTENMWVDISRNAQEYEEYLWRCEEEKMRQLYVAATRAKKRLYLPLFIYEGEKMIPIGTGSPMELFLMRMIYPHIFGENIYRSLLQLHSADVVQWIQNFIGERQITYEILTKNTSILPSVIFESYRRLSTNFSFSFPVTEVLSFSQLVSPHIIRNINPIEQIETNNSGIHALPPGSITGTILHEVFDAIVQRGIFSPFKEKCIESVIREKITHTHLFPYCSDIIQMVKRAFHIPLSPYSFSLVDVHPVHGLSEMQFVYALPNKIYMKGIIDIIFRSNDTYFILDWKSHCLGRDDASYTEENLQKVMNANNYLLQARIYARALQKYLSHIDSRPFSECFGGVIYIFIRGLSSSTSGICHISLPQIGNIDELFYNAE